MIVKILSHLGLPTEPMEAEPAEVRVDLFCASAFFLLAPRRLPEAGAGDQEASELRTLLCDFAALCLCDE